MNAKKNERLKVVEVEKVREALAEAVGMDKYVQYSQEKGPLQVTKLAPEDRNKPSIQEAIGLFGWPSLSDGRIKPAKRYADNEGFLDALLVDSNSNTTSAFSDAVLEDPDADISTLLEVLENSNEKKKHINELKNFINWLYQKPTTAMYDNTEGWDGLYGRHPLLHRLYAVMPDLVEPMRKLLLHIRDRHEHGADTAGFNEELSLGVNDNLVTAMRMTYAVAGRLLTVEDTRLQYKLATGRDAAHLPEVTDAFTELIT